MPGVSAIVSYTAASAGREAGPCVTPISSPRPGSTISVRIVGDLHSQVLAEAVIGVSVAEVMRGCGHWPNCEQVQLATLQWSDWFKQP